jgi:predicted enzyme related to lactoylglutathione lyase
MNPLPGRRPFDGRAFLEPMETKMNRTSKPERGRLAASGWRRMLSAALLCAASAGATAAPPSFRWQPLVDPGEAEHHVGKFVFAELVTPDLKGAEKFYEGLFGWTFHDLGTRYTEATVDGRIVAGIEARPLGSDVRRQPRWLSFIATHDVDALGRTALANGARVLADPHDAPGRGRVAVYADPQGAVFGVMASASGDPPDVLAEPGTWIWHSLFVKDTDTDAAFYQTLFNYEVFDLPEESDARHLVLASDDYARASANSLPSERSHPLWLGYIRVADATAAAARAVALGGKVLLAPRDDRHGGKLAIVADPQGAPVGLLEWSASEEQNRTVKP